MKKELIRFSEELHNLFNEFPDHVAVVDTLDYVLGALYSFAKASEKGASLTAPIITRCNSDRFQVFC